MGALTAALAHEIHQRQEFTEFIADVYCNNPNPDEPEK